VSINDRNDWVKMHGCSIEGVRPRGRPNKARTEVVAKDYSTQQLNQETALDLSK